MPPMGPLRPCRKPRAPYLNRGGPWRHLACFLCSWQTFPDLRGRILQDDHGGETFCPDTEFKRSYGRSCRPNGRRCVRAGGTPGPGLGMARRQDRSPGQPGHVCALAPQPTRVLFTPNGHSWFPATNPISRCGWFWEAFPPRPQSSVGEPLYLSPGALKESPQHGPQRLRLQPPWTCLSLWTVRSPRTGLGYMMSIFKE